MDEKPPRRNFVLAPKPAKPHLGPPVASTNLKTFDAADVLRSLAGDNPTDRTAARVGGLLARKLGRVAPFASSYIQNVALGRQPLSGKLALALRAVWVERNGGHPIKGSFEPAQGYARPGSFETGSLILADSRRCARLACNCPFVPRTHNQVYCCPECKALDRKRGAPKRAPHQASPG